MALVSASRVPSRQPPGVVAAIASGLVMTLMLGLWRVGLTDHLPWTAPGGAVFSVTGAGAADWTPLGQRSTIHAADGTVLAVLHDEVNRRVVTLEEVPAHVRQAVLTAEDRRFYDHGGYDSVALTRALLANAQAWEVRQGGSTITQQLAKQNFVGSATSLRRKLVELAYALRLERRYSKDQLLERYLNQVYFGAGAYGIAAAAEEFFRVGPDQLTVPQAALLAGMIRAPARLDPRRWPEAAKTRRDHLLAGMAAEGYLHRRDLAGLQATPIDLSPPLLQAPASRTSSRRSNGSSSPTPRSVPRSPSASACCSRAGCTSTPPSIPDSSRSPSRWWPTSSPARTGRRVRWRRSTPGRVGCWRCTAEPTSQPSSST